MTAKLANSQLSFCYVQIAAIETIKIKKAEPFLSLSLFDFRGIL
jgi:hypothetical protein